jgi:hypothetical protein
MSPGRAGPSAPERRPDRVLRLATAAISLALVAFAFLDDGLISGRRGFGWSQAAVLAVGLAAGASCFAPRAWNARVLALLVSSGLTLGAAEVLLRPVLGPRYEALIELDERVLYRLRPDRWREYTLAPINGGGRIRYRINRQGFRGEELAAPGGPPRVVVYGDSFVMAEFSRTEDTFSERLEAHLARGLGAEVEVVNAGVAGYGPDQVLRRMEAELASLRPALVIVAIYAGNDFGDVVRNKLYRLSGGGALSENRFSIAEEVRTRVSVGQRELILKKALRDVLRRLSGGAEAAIATGPEARRERVEAALAQLVAEYREYVVEGDSVVRELLSDPYNADVSLLPGGDSARYRVAVVEQVVARIRDTAEAQGVPLRFVLIPSPIDVTDGHEAGEVDPARHPEYRRSALTDVLEEICRRTGVQALNLFAPFRERGADALYLKGVDDHWNERGQDQAAELVGGWIVAHGLLRAPAASAP